MMEWKLSSKYVFLTHERIFEWFLQKYHGASHQNPRINQIIDKVRVLEYDEKEKLRMIGSSEDHERRRRAGSDAAATARRGGEPGGRESDRKDKDDEKKSDSDDDDKKKKEDSEGIDWDAVAELKNFDAESKSSDVNKIEVLAIYTKRKDVYGCFFLNVKFWSNSINSITNVKKIKR